MWPASIEQSTQQYPHAAGLQSLLLLLLLLPLMAHKLNKQRMSLQCLHAHE
jgi:hypothetical protein